MPKRFDLTGQIFGELTAIRLADDLHGFKSLPWECKCTCGKTTYVLTGSLRAGMYKSCGCKRIAKRDKGVKKHIVSDQIDGTRKSALIAKAHKDSKSGVKGVMWMESRKKWKAYIGVTGKQITIGYFANIDDAVNARKDAEEKYHKPYLK
ncbi:hypothetical protein J2Z32_003721 [Paenibacillus turicensis]|uniref:AP2/ERF domain-containing protein n=1 Tax=Paenibacillus turicensis TaxID=160487 RepID=A0ABS4FWU9_9BACL|nr:HNH endonuclease [Paenibacillus turicensis]MBP1907056.1 hypothetical protein [Paenibacillus turicensis]